MKNSVRNIMKWFIIICLMMMIIIVGLSKVKAQRISDNSFNAAELVYSTQDNAVGFNYYMIRSGKGFVAGAEFGNYRYGDLSSVDHAKYKLGFAVDLKESDASVYGNDGSGLLYVSCCYNDYHTNYNKYNDINVDALKDITFEIGVKYCFPDDKIFTGFHYDVNHRTGGFTIGLMFNRK